MTSHLKPIQWCDKTELKDKGGGSIHPENERQWPLLPLITIMHHLLQTGFSPAAVEELEIDHIHYWRTNTRSSLHVTKMDHSANLFAIMISSGNSYNRTAETLLLVGLQARKVEFTLHVVPTTIPLLLPYYWLTLGITTGIEFQDSIQTRCRRTLPHVHQLLHASSFLLHLIWSLNLSSFPAIPSTSSASHSFACWGFLSAGCAHHFITLMYLLGFSRRSRPPVMQRQMLSVQLLLMFKVIQADRLIKRRLRDVLGPSLSHLAGLVTSGSRVLLPRLKGWRIKMFHPEHRLSHVQARIFHPLSPWPQRSVGFTIVQVFAGRRLVRGLIKPDIYSGTVAKSQKGESDQRRWGCWPFLHLSYWMIQIQHVL